MNIGDKVSRAIKEGKWLHISYINQNGENTFYWVAVQDIDFENKKLKVSMFNDKLSMKVYNSTIFFDKIQSAEVVEFSSYQIQDSLINKIEKNLDKCKWLNYDHFNHNILNYYIECNILDMDPSQKNYASISGVDLYALRSEKVFKLDDEQVKRVMTDIYHYDLKNKTNNHYTLAINVFSITDGKNKFVIAYFPVTFNPIEKAFVLGTELKFNKSFVDSETKQRKHSLFNYINMDMDEFVSNFAEKYVEYKAIIQENLRPGERVDERPDLMLLEREIRIKLSETYNVIEEKYNTNNLPVPLKAFFGNIAKKDCNRRKEPELIIYDKRVDISQMRVLYNAMKLPITYVQGPPGTGKTQTILNVILSAFYNDKTTLVCSSNNRPVDGIIEKLVFEHNGDTVKFPYIRLGNMEEVKKATLKIRELYQYQTSKKAKEELLNKIKETTNDKNARLIEMLRTQEERTLAEEYLASAKKLLDSFKGNNSSVINVIKYKIGEFIKKRDSLPIITNKEVVELFEPLTESYKLSQFLYFKSLQYITKLQKPRYKELIEICYIQDSDDRAVEFNKWMQKDENMKLLNDVFPIIFSTNISASRLGTPNYMFDLVIMDEAGQCNVATALIPIAKAESLLLVGDPNQLKPVVILDDIVNTSLMDKYNIEPRYSYKNNSILKLMKDNDKVSNYILLKYHYRCAKKIIDFSNQRYYNNQLDLSYIDRMGNVSVLEVNNRNIQQKNEAVEEGIEIINYLKRNNINDAYIVTPYVNQKELLQSLIKQNGINGVECGTIHSLQGAEKSTIILSTALSNKTRKSTFNWLKNNYELLNVAVTRAKDNLVIAADLGALDHLSDKNDDLYTLVQYVKTNGKVIVPPNETIKIEIGKSNGSKAEDEFYKTITHFCTCHKVFDADRNVKMGRLFKDTPADLRNYEFDLVLFEKKYWGNVPVIIFEVNGPEHFGVRSREMSDRLKMEIGKKKDVQLVFISNEDVLSYNYIADIIYSARTTSVKQQQSIYDLMKM